MFNALGFGNKDFLSWPFSRVLGQCIGENTSLGGDLALPWKAGDVVVGSSAVGRAPEGKVWPHLAA